MSLARYLSKLGSLVGSNGKVPTAGIDDLAVTAAKLHTTAVTDKLGYTPPSVADTNYSITDGGAVQIYVDESPIRYTHSGDSSDWKTMFSWKPSKTGAVKVRVTAYIASGTYYFAYRVRSASGVTLFSGNYGNNLDAGQISSVHNYRRFMFDINVNAGDAVSFQMISSNSSGAAVAGNGQALYAKEFRVYSDEMSMEYGGPIYTLLPRAFTDASVNYDHHPERGSNSFAMFTGFNYKHLGQLNFRGGSRYLDVKTNLSGDNIMMQFLAHGYLYNHGNIFAIRGGYTYTSNSVINQQNNSLTGGNQIINLYRDSAGQLCLKLDKQSSDYTEGEVSIYFHAHDKSTQNAALIIAYAQNNSAGSYF